MKATTVKEVLQAMEYMIANVGWCQGASARNKHGFPTPVSPHSEIASMCLVGALDLVEINGPLWADTKNHLVKYTHTPSLVSFNDAPGRTKEEVLAVLRQAIEALP